MELSKQVHGRATKTIREMEHLPYEDKAGSTGALQPGEEKALGGLYSSLQYLEGTYRTRGNGFRLEHGRFRLHIRKKFFTERVVRRWNRLLREVLDAPSLETFKTRLDEVLSNFLSREGGRTAGGLKLDDLQGPFQLKPFYDSLTGENYVFKKFFILTILKKKHI